MKTINQTSQTGKQILTSSLVFMAILASTLLMPSFSYAQNNNGSNVSVGGVLRSTDRNTGLTETSVQRNSTGSCDSTCDAMGGTAAAMSAVSSFVTQIQACGAGYTGSKTQTRTQNPDGSFTPWVDADTSHCVCSPTYTDSIQTCALPLAGTFVRRTPWVCNAGVGSLGSPTTVSNSCFTPCALPTPSVQNSSAACGNGYTGSGYTYQNTASCPGGVGANSSSVWSGWVTTASNCTPLPNKLFIRDFLWSGDVVVQDAFVVFRDYAGVVRLVNWDEAANNAWNTNQKFPDVFPSAPAYPGGYYFLGYGQNPAVWDTLLPPRQF